MEKLFETVLNLYRYHFDIFKDIMLNLSRFFDNDIIINHNHYYGSTPQKNEDGGDS